MLRSRPTVLVLLTALVLVAVTPALSRAEKEPPSGAKDEAKKKADPDIFAPRLDLTIWTIFVFGVLLWVLKKYAWGPMLAGLQGREAAIREALDEAHSARDEAQQLRTQLQAEMDKVHDKMRELMDEARREGQVLKERMHGEAQAAIQAERERFRRETELEVAQAKQELRNQAAQLAALVSAKVIGRSLTPEDHRGLVDEAVAELDTAAAQKTTA